MDNKDKQRLRNIGIFLSTSFLIISLLILFVVNSLQTASGVPTATFTEAGPTEVAVVTTSTPEPTLERTVVIEQTETIDETREVTATLVPSATSTTSVTLSQTPLTETATPSETPITQTATVLPTAQRTAVVPGNPLRPPQVTTIVFVPLPNPTATFTPDPPPPMELPPTLIEPDMPDLSPEPVPNQVVLRFDEDTPASEIQAAIAQLGGSQGQIIDMGSLGRAVVVRTSANIDVNEVDNAEYNYFIGTLVQPQLDDTHYPSQWALPAIAAPQAWLRMPNPSQSVTIAVIDSGECSNHADLSGRYLAGYNFIDFNQPPTDDFNHGCRVSGIIAANANNNQGIVGVAPNAYVMSLKVLDNTGIGTYANVAAAIVYAVDNGADIINISLGGVNPSPLLLDAVTYAHQHDVIVVAAAGNTGQQGVLYPAAYPNVIAVGSLDPNMQRSSFSTYGPEIALLAPGRNIITTDKNGSYVTVSGTSFAAPYVAGAAAVEIALGRELVLGGNLEIGKSANPPVPTPTQPTPVPTPVEFTKISHEVLESIQQSGSTRVIISLGNDQTALSTENSPEIVAALQDSVIDALSAGDFVLAYQYSEIPALVGTISEADLIVLENNADVRSVRIDQATSAHMDQVGNLIQIPQARSYYQQTTGSALTGSGITVAVLDSGVDANHIDLQSDIVAQYCSLDRTVNASTPSGECEDNADESDVAVDRDGHGTHIASIITRPQNGIAPDAKIVAVQVLNAQGVGYVSDWLAGLNWLIANGEAYNVRVINMSLGTGTLYSGNCDSYFPDVVYAINRLVTNDVVIFASSGNEGSPNRMAAPACLSNVIAVGATYDEDFERRPAAGTYRDNVSASWPACYDQPAGIAHVTCFTNRSTMLDIVAPGAVISASRLNGGIVPLAGTSMASPVAAGAAALLLQVNPDLTPAEIELILKDSADSINDDGQAYRRINVNQAVRRADQPSFSCNQVTEIPQSECEALSTIFNSTEGASWRSRIGWMRQDVPVCNWEGITCVDGHVTTLSLPGRNLNGNIPVELSALPYLQTLDLSANLLAGPIPPALGSLTRLTSIDLSSNRLTGGIPAELGNLNELRVLLLDRNQFSQSIPINMRGLRRLETLDLSYNMLMPSEINRLTNFLRRIDGGAWSNTQTIPPSGVTVTPLSDTSVEVSWNAIPFTSQQGYYIIQYGRNNLYFGTARTNDKLTTRVVIDNLQPGITYDFIVKTYTAGFGTPFSSDWQQNALISQASAPIVSITTGSFCQRPSITVPFGECHALELLYLGTNGNQWTNDTGWLENPDLCQWYGITCDSIGNHIVAINLSSNNLKGNLPINEFSSLHFVEVLSLANNQLSGSIPFSIGLMDALRELALNDNTLTGGIPVTFQYLSKLETLNLANNNLSGALPDVIGVMRALATIDASNNRFSGNIPSLSMLTNLKSLDLSQNLFSGSIPALSASIDELNLSQNRLSGAILPNVNFANLRILDLSANAFTGSVSPSIGLLTNLEVLNLSRNQLDQTLPIELGSLTQLRQLNLAQNRFTGTVPLNLGNLTLLTDLNIAYNAFSGSIPAGITALESLVAADFGYNMFVDGAASGFVSEIDPDWTTTQTVAPNTLNLFVNGPTSLFISWPTIPYIADGGNYEILCRTTPDGEYDRTYVTASKSHNSFEITGLVPEETYYCVVRTITPKHGPQQNDLTSGNSVEVIASTATFDITPDEPATLGVSQDTYVATNSNNGGARYLFIGTYSDVTTGSTITIYRSRALLGFGSIEAQLPPNAIITGISLVVGHYGTNNNHDAVYVASIQGPWNESTTWSTQPSYVNNYGSLHFPPYDADFTVITNPKPQWRTIPLDMSVIDVLNNGYGLMLRNVDENRPGVVICSRQSPVGDPLCPGYEPYLQIEYVYNQPPEAAYDPSPEDNASNQPLVVEANWAASTDPDNDPITYNVYLSTVNPLPVTQTPTASGLTEPGYTFTDLDFLTTYYWQVETVDTHGNSTRSAVWNFTTRDRINCELVTDIPLAECNALRALFESTNTPAAKWHRQTNWLQTTEVCGSTATRWAGVDCVVDPANPAVKHVSVLQLNDNNLSGSLPVELGNLPYLRWLYLENNAITGSIPPSIGQLVRLEQINLSGNKLTGTLPTQLGNLNSLLMFYAADNDLTGGLPSQMGDLANLEGVRLNGNQLTGQIPPQWGNLRNLRELNLSNNGLTGEIPATLINAGSTNSAGTPLFINLSYNGLFAVDTDLNAFLATRQPNWVNTQTVAPSNLRVEPVSGYSVNTTWDGILYNSGNGVYEVAYKTSADTSFITGCSVPQPQTSCTINGLIPGETYLFAVRTKTSANTTQLNTIWSDFSPTVETQTSNSFCDVVIGISKPECQALELLYYQTDGEAWTDNTGWLQSTTPCLDWYGVSCEGEHITGLDLSSNHLVNTLPDVLAQLPNLKSLDLSGNLLIGNVWSSALSTLSNLQTLDLSSNAFAGDVPTAMRDLQSLTQLDIGFNKLTVSDMLVQEFLNIHDPDWAESQTIPPENVSVDPATITYNSFVVTWSPILYTGDTGYYEVYYSTDVDGNYVFGCRTLSKSETSCQVSGLQSGRRYYIAVTSTTEPHGEQVNLLSSALSISVNPVVVQTLNDSLDTATDIPEVPYENIQDITEDNWGTVVEDLIPSCAKARYFSLSGGRYFSMSGGRYFSLSGGRYFSLSGGDGYLTFDTAGSTFDTVISIWTLDSSGNPIELACADDKSADDFTSLLYIHIPPEDAVYYVQIGQNVEETEPAALQTTSTIIGRMVFHADLVESLACNNVSDLPQAECEVLYDLYQSTNGVEWVNDANWLQSNTPCSWNGITCRGGHVAEINLPNNSLDGHLPASLVTLPNLQVLNLSHNQLTGQLLDVTGNWHFLKRLDLSNNSLTGLLPVSLFGLTNLEQIDLSGNSLSGLIPENIQAMTTLGVMDFSNNMLEGPIPATIVNLPGLAQLDLSFNKLFASRSDIADFVSAVDPDALTTQTLPPEQVTVTRLSSTSVYVEWIPIAYVGDTGYYQLLRSLSPNGPYEPVQVTTDKSATGIVIEDLLPDTNYYFVVSTFTAAHGEQKNDLWSTMSAAATLAVPTPTPTPSILDLERLILECVLHPGHQRALQAHLNARQWDVFIYHIQTPALNLSPECLSRMLALVGYLRSTSGEAETDEATYLELLISQCVSQQGIQTPLRNHARGGRWQQFMQTLERNAADISEDCYILMLTTANYLQTLSISPVFDPSPTQPAPDMPLIATVAPEVTPTPTPMVEMPPFEGTPQPTVVIIPAAPGP